MIRKRLLCIFLTSLLLFTGLVSSYTEVSATNRMITDIYSDDITVESGRQFYIGDMILVKLDEKSVTLPEILSTKEENCLYLSTEMGATYVSDCSEVLTVEEKSGYAEAKAAGIANITITCQGIDAKIPVKVVEKGTLSAGKETLIEKWDAAGRKLAKKVPEKLTVDNGYDLFRALKTYLATFAASPLKDECRGSFAANRMLRGWDPDGEFFRLAPACSCYERAYSMMKHYIAKYHPMYDKKYWTAEKGKYFKVSAVQDKITLKMKKKLTKQALLALYLNEIICEVDGMGPDGLMTPLGISTTIQRNCLEARVYISKYHDPDSRYTGGTLMLFKLGSKTATATHVYRTRYNPTNGRYKYHHKKKLKLNKGKTYYLRLYTMEYYWPDKFIVK